MSGNRNPNPDELKKSKFDPKSCGLYTLFKTPASEHVHQFLTHVVRGEKAEVEAMIQRDPRLLLEKMQVKDEAGVLKSVYKPQDFGSKFDFFNSSGFGLRLPDITHLVCRSLFNVGHQFNRLCHWKKGQN